MFPTDAPHSEFATGVTMIETDGTTLGVNTDFNGTGACVGGFTGYTEGMPFFLDATNGTDGDLAVGYDMGDWGPGLTAAAVRDDFGGGGRFALEAGILPLSDRGMAAIDEFDKISEEDRRTMHPAMEQQRLDVSKGGVKATLNTMNRKKEVKKNERTHSRGQGPQRWIRLCADSLRYRPLRRQG